MSNPGIDSILAAAAKPTHCKCGHNKTAHSNYVENHPCEKVSCGCLLFRPAVRYYPEADKDDLYDLLVSVASENAVWKDRLEAHESCGAKYARLSKTFNTMRSSHDRTIVQLQQLSEIDQQTIEAQARKLTVYEQLLNMAVDGGRIGSELFDTMTRGLQAEDDMNTKAVLAFLGTPDVPEHVKRVLDLIFDRDMGDDDDDDLVAAHICESEDCDDPSHDDDYVTPRDLQVNMSASSEAQKLKDAAEEVFGLTEPGNDRADKDQAASWSLAVDLHNLSNSNDNERDVQMGVRPVKDDPQA